MDFVKGIFNAVANPKLFFVLAVLGLVVLVWKRERLASNTVGYGLLAFLTVFFVFGLFDDNFKLIVTKPDNVPIVGLIFLLVFFVWYSMREAVLNDRRIAAGQGPVEKAESDRVWVWPDLVYTELISLIVFSVVLIVWSILLRRRSSSRRIPRTRRIHRKRRGTSSDCRKCWCISIRGSRAWCCPASSSSG